MGLLGRVAGWFTGRGERRPDDAPRTRLGAKYDAAQTTKDNAAHWANADGLSATAANDPETRRKLRNRARYEYENNGYIRAMVDQRAESTVGTGPRLQLILPGAYAGRDLDRGVEVLWADWADAVGLVDKLLVMEKAEARDGEIFVLFSTDESVPGVPFNLQLIEADQVETPTFDPALLGAVSGVVLDRNGNPTAYHVLRRHPGDTWDWRGTSEYDTIPADRVIHYFVANRAGQARGVPPIHAALPLVSQLRRFTRATLAAAELNASISGVTESDYEPAVPGEEQDAAWEPDEFAITPGMILDGPAGKRFKFLDQKSPSPNYGEFKREVMTEAGRSIGAPRNVSTGSSAEYNYSSARLDNMPEQRATRIRRDRIRRIVLDRVFRKWAEIGSLISGYHPAGVPPVDQWRTRWRWDGFGSIDPVKDATAAEILLRSGQTTLESVAGERGEDWEEVLEQQAREAALRARLGLPAPGAATSPAAPAEDTDGDTEGRRDA